MNSQELRNLQEAYMEVYASPEQKGEFELWVDSLLGEGYDLSDYTWDEMYEFYLDEAIRNPESRAKLRDIENREVRKGDKSKGENPRSKYPTEKGRLAGHLLRGRNPYGSEERNPVRSRGGTNAPADQRVGRGPNRAAAAAYWASGAGPNRDRGKGSNAKRRLKTEEYVQADLYDIVLSHLLDEGYAETPEAAEVIMVNMSEEWVESIVEEVLDEAEGSYGQTPQSTKRWNKATVSRMNKPASEYPKRGDKKKEVEKYSKHNQRTMSLDHDASRGPGKKSSRGSGGRLGLKMTQKDRDNARGQAQYGHTGYDSGLDGGPSAPGSKPKGKKLERQRKTGVSAD
jgi:hypothetical protein